MKAWYLLLGLMMLCAAGVDTVNSSNGYLADQNPTPFAIFGHALYEGGAPCNSPNVNITNLNTGATWYVDTVSGSNYYQTLLRAVDVSAGDVLRWSVTDGTVFNITNHTVGLGDLESGGIFGFDMILQSIAPRIIGYDLESPVYDIENATRRFNVTIDQVVNVTWLINGSPVHTNWSVTDASYTHANVAVGVWNVSARASNGNGTAVQKWIWNVTTLPPPVNTGKTFDVSGSNTTEPVLLMIYGWVFHENGSVCRGHAVNISNPNTGTWWQADTHPDHHYYQLVLDAENVSVGDVLQIDASKGGVPIDSTEHIITQKEISDGAAIVNLNGLIDLTVSDPISFPRYFCAGRNSTIMAVIVNEGTPYTGGFEASLFANGTLIDTTDVPSVDPGGNRSVGFNWMPDHEGNYTIVVMADSGRTIDETDESNNNRSAEICVRFADIDLAITDEIYLNKTPLDGDIIRVNAAIGNQGNDTADNFSVVFYDNDVAFHTEIMSLNAGGSNNVSACWDASYGEHDIRVIVDPDDMVGETNEANNQRNLSVSVGRSSDFTITNVSFALDGLPCSPLELEWGKNVTMNATVGAVNHANRGRSARVKFYQDARYAYMGKVCIGETEVLFGKGNSTRYATVEWHINDDHSIGDQNITTIIDPDGEVYEPDESNNEMVIPIHVKASDFTVTHITADRNSVLFGETVELNATIENLGSVAGNVDVAFVVGSTVLGSREISVNAGGKVYASTGWNTSKTTLAGDCIVTAKVDPDNKICEINEGNNSRSTEVFVNGTDLTISEIVLHNEADDVYVYGADDLFNVTAIVENIGAIPAGDFAVEFEYNGSVFDRINISGLGVGDACSIDTVWDLSNATIDEDQMFIVRIDGCGNPDNDAANNEDTSGEIPVMSPWDVTKITFNPDNPMEDPREGEDVIVTAAIENIGSRDGTTDVRFYANEIEYNKTGVYVEANSIEDVSTVLSDVRVLFPRPDYVGTVWDMRVEVDDRVDDIYVEKPLHLALPNLTVFIDPPASAVYDETVDVNIRVTNNGDETVKTTLWFYVANHTVYPIEYCDWEERTLSIAHPDALNMSIYFNDITLSGALGGRARYIITGTDENLIEEKSAFGSNPVISDRWTKWGAGDTINITYKRVEGTISSGALLNTMPITLAAHESQNFAIPWCPPLGEHTLWARVSSANNSTFVHTITQDLAVTDLSVDPIVDDGDVLNITATIENIGSFDLTDFKVRFFNDSNEFCVRNMSGSDMSGRNITTVATTWRASTWNESEGRVTSNHTLSVEVDPCENLDGDKSNNYIGRIVHVNPTRDFSVTDITFFMANETLDPMEDLRAGVLTIINATIDITNLASCGGSVDVSWYLDDDTEPTNTTTVPFSANNGTVYAEFEWKIDAFGNHTITVIADPENEILELNESNNTSSQSIYIRAPDLVVGEIILDLESPEEGDMVNITATVGNLGNMDVDNATVAFCDRGNYTQYGNWKATADATVTITQPDAAGIRVHFKEWYLFNGRMYIYYGDGNQFIDVTYSNWGKDRWTEEWIPGSSVRIKIIDTSDQCNSFAVIDRYEYCKIFNRTNRSLEVNTSKEIQTKWLAYPPGPHEIVIIADPDDLILESNETNNELTNSIVVQGPDLTVSDMRLTVNGTEINATETVITAGEVVNISAMITNIGIKPARNFNVSLCLDDTEIANQTNLSLNMGESVNVSATWNTSAGNYTIAVTADPEKRIHETNESNNTAAVDVSVQGADLVVTDFTYTVMPPDNATANDTGRLYDTDTIRINATIANQGILPADNFSAHIFYGKCWLGDYSESPDLEDQRWKWIEKTLDGAGCMYVKIRNAENIEGNMTIYDRNDSTVARPECDGWFFVEGDEANVYFNDVRGVGFDMSFYAGDFGDFQRYDNLSTGTGKSENLTPMLQQVFTIGNPVVGVFVDPLNNVSENSEENNYADHVLTVHPSRDFAVNNMRLIHSGSELGVNDTIADGDNLTVDVSIGMNINESDPYHEYRKGIVDVDIIDEREWARAQPRYELTPYGYGYAITYPGADAIRVHFDDLHIYPGKGSVTIRDKDGEIWWECRTTWKWTGLGYKKRSISINSSWVDGDTVYVYSPVISTDSNVFINKYQYRKINRTPEGLAANETAHIPARFTLSAGNHTIHAITDPDDRIGEMNESNNETNGTIHVEPCRDPAAVNITFIPEMPPLGSAVDVIATVANHGNRTATFTVDLYATKFEYRPYESPHPDYDGEEIYNDLLEDIATYPEANRTGVHFTRIDTDCGDAGLPLRVCDRGGNTSVNYYKFNGSDVWAWVNGDLLMIDTEVVCNADCCPWGFSIDTVAHNVTLNRTTVTLDPGESADITGILPNVRIGHRSDSYTVTAVVDQDNVIFETDESNNEVNRELVASCSDLTVSDRLHFTDGKAMAKIENDGTSRAEDVEVRFGRDIEFSGRERHGMKISAPGGEDDIDAIRVHFKELDISGKNSLYIRKSWRPPDLQKYTSGDYSDSWSGWVEGDHLKIYRNGNVKFEIDRYEYAKDESLDDISDGEVRKCEIPWTEYEEPYNLTIYVDPGDDIFESNEDNNNETVLIYVDLRADWIEFVSPGMYMLSLDAEKFIINGHITATFPVSEFNVTLEVRNLYPNGTIGDIVFNITKYVEEPFSAGQNEIQFEFDPEEKFEVGGNYTVSLIADSTGDICESNDLYPVGEDNNVTSMDIYVYNSSGYTGGGDLINVAKGEVCGKVVYTVGDSRYRGVMEHGEERTVRYPETIPDDVGDIKFARLFVYWFTYHKVAGRWIPELADIDVTFNDHTLKKDGNYSDNPGATGFDYGYGLYSYDVTDYANKGGNAATVKNNADWGPYYGVGVHAIGLLVVYEDEDEPLTKYWVNEGADIMMAANSRHPTGLPSGDCITTAIFDDVERNDTENVCATLLTVLGMYVSYDKSDLFSVKGDSLEFNGRPIGSPIDTGYWKHYSDSRIALTSDEWDAVTDYLKRGDNLAEIHSKGNYMLANNAFLRLIFPPDLNVIDLDAPASTVVGAHHSINATIRNDGKSDAHDFNVTLEIDGKQMVRIPHLDLPAGNSTTVHLYNWTPKMLMHVYNLTAAADVLSGEDWTEIETDNNAMTKYVTIEEGGFGNQTGPRGTGGGSNPTGGVYTEKITGRVMQGMKDFLSFGGGGGAGMFSLTEWIMKGAVWLVLLLFVCSGYFMEQRSYGRVSGGYAGGL